MFCYGPLVSELGGQSAWCPPTPSLGGGAPRPPAPSPMNTGLNLHDFLLTLTTPPLCRCRLIHSVVILLCTAALWREGKLRRHIGYAQCLYLCERVTIVKHGDIHGIAYFICLLSLAQTKCVCMYVCMFVCIHVCITESELHDPTVNSQNIGSEDDDSLLINNKITCSQWLVD